MHQRLSTWLFAAILFPWTASASTANHLPTVDGRIAFADRLVSDVLKDYQLAGFEIIYSTDVVRHNLRFNKEPPTGLHLERLRTGLSYIGLDLEPSEISHQLLIIPASTQPALFTPPTESLIPENPVKTIEEVVVTSSRYQLKKHRSVSQHSMNADDINSIPDLGEDALRVAAYLPGMSSIGISARPHIRGGLKDETLVLFNGIELLEPFHMKDFQSIFSGLNPSIIDSIDVYTGGFPVRYGDRMSGVMDILPASNPEDFGAEFSLSLLTLSGAAYGSTAGGRGDWVISARRGNLDLLAQQINPNVGKPSYSDAYAQFDWQLNSATILEWGLLLYNDDIELIDMENGIGESGHTKYQNTYSWLVVDRDHGDKLSSRYTLSYGSIHHRRNGLLIDPDPDEGNAITDDRRRFNILSARYQLDKELPNDGLMELGAQLSRHWGRYNYEASINRGELAILLGLPESEQRRINRNIIRTSGGAYGSIRHKLTSKISIEGGIRWDFQRDTDLGFQHQLSPRVSLLYHPWQWTKLRLSLGIFHQPEAIHEIQVADGINKFQRAQRAEHLIAGVDHLFGDSGWSLRIEGFFKNFSHPKRRFENRFNSLVIVPEVKPDRIAIAPSSARARGVEITVRYNPSENINLWTSYTNANVEDRIDSTWRPRAWNQEHSAVVGGSLVHGAWSYSALLSWHTGWRTTLLPSQLPEFTEIELEPNGSRLPAYVSLNMRISRTWDWSNQSLSLFAEATNLLSRNNVGGIEYEIESNDDGSLAFNPERRTLLGILPSIGIEYRFH